MRMIFLGPPGAGKGTQAALISGNFGLTHMSTGDILRDNVKDNTEIGKKARSFMEKGELVPDDIVIDMMLDAIKRTDRKKGFILDGFPRTLYQAKRLDEELKKEELPIDLALYFKTTLETILFRLTGRRICRKCGAIYHIVNMPPKKEGVCDKCGGELYQRKDDNEETVRKRLEVYDSQTQDLIGYYKEKGVLKEVQGDLDAGEVYKEIAGILNDRDKVRG
jgi:adenylate kinase